MLLFVFKNKDAFLVHEKLIIYSKTGGGGIVSTYSEWKRHHSRMQVRYRGYEIFNKSHRNIRNENQLLNTNTKLEEKTWNTVRKSDIRGEKMIINFFISPMIRCEPFLRKWKNITLRIWMWIRNVIFFDFRETMS